MKKLLLNAFTALFFSSMLLAQKENTLSDVAAQLFKNIKTKLTVTEKNKIATNLGFILSGNKDQPFTLDKDSKEYPFGAAVMPTDMNNDGKEEIFVVFGNSFTSGNTGSSIILFIKDATGVYTSHLGFPGMAPDVLATVSKGYPDLLIGGPGFEFPVWRWDGKTYKLYKNVKDKDYNALKKKSTEDASKAYQQGMKE